MTEPFEITREHKRCAAEAAARWWTDRLRDAAGVGDNGSDEMPSVMAGLLAHMLRSEHRPTPENCAAFAQELAKRLGAALQCPEGREDRSGFDMGGNEVVLEVDYHPCEMLYESLLAAGIDANVASAAALPLKTIMRVSARRVLVSHGYGSRPAEIYGPIWGCTYAEQQAAITARWEAKQELRDWYDAHRADPRAADAYFGKEWHGPLR